MGDVRNEINLLSETLDTTTLPNLTMKYYLLELAAKVLGNPGMFYSVYNGTFICSPEARHKSFLIGDQESVIIILMLRYEAHLQSYAHLCMSLGAQEFF